MNKSSSYPVVKDIDFTTSEKLVSINECYKLVIYPFKECSISFNNNKNYKRYPSNVAIPIELNSKICEPIKSIYIKGSEKGVCGIWGYV